MLNVVHVQVIALLESMVNSFVSWKLVPSEIISCVKIKLVSWFFTTLTERLQINAPRLLVFLIFHALNMDGLMIPKSLQLQPLLMNKALCSISQWDWRRVTTVKCQACFFVVLVVVLVFCLCLFICLVCLFYFWSAFKTCGSLGYLHSLLWPSEL